MEIQDWRVNQVAKIADWKCSTSCSIKPDLYAIWKDSFKRETYKKGKAYDLWYTWGCFSWFSTGST